MNEVTIMSANCQGLGDYLKRKDVFSYLREKCYSIYCLQDTHFTSETEDMIRNQWGYNVYFNSFKSNCRGVAILLNNNFEYKVNKERKDDCGNFLALSIEIDGINTTLITVYGPNTDSPGFYDLISETIESFNNDHVIICGDFNLVLNPDLDYDKNYRHIKNPKARNKILEIIECYALVDVYREMHEDSRRYTWRKNNPIKQARLDFFLVSENLLCNILKSAIEPGYRSDNSFPSIVLKFNEFKKGKGLWKFNNSLLMEKEYLNIVKSCIEDVKLQYCLPVYNRESIHDIPEENLQFLIDDQLFLEVLLMEIRGRTISYSSFRKKQQNFKERNLQKEIQALEDQEIFDLETLEVKKKELEEIRLNKLKGSVIRSRAKWIEEGEKPTKYFFGLENRNFISKIIPRIEKENGDIITKQDDILEEICSFYKKLYSQNTDIEEVDLEELLKYDGISKLKKCESEKLEGLISKSEAGYILKSMKNNKSPGSDGFTTEFFKCFWKYLGTFIVRSLNYGYTIGQLSITQRQGIITCIPKSNKPKHFLKNWRPISLLNIVYKIASGVVASRIKKTLDKLISKDQTGFLPGRYIGENTRLVYDIMQYTEQNDIPGMLLMIDFEKAFDSVSWTFIDKVFHFFGYGESIINWVKTLHTNVSSSINQGGNLSPFIHIQRGCRQGDPIAPYIFILCAEILAIRIRNNKKIKGINVENYPILMSQYADDTSLILDGSETSLQEAITELNNFAKISGLKINIDKTQVVWIGSKRFSEDKFFPELKLVWGKSKFTLLGIEFSTNLHEIPKINFDKKLIKLKALVKTWSKRNITPLGRIHIIKSLLISQFNHLFISLPNPDDSFLNKVNTILFNFLWNSKTDKVKRDVITQSYDQGGIKMINLKAFLYSLKLSWFKRLFQTTAKWQNILKTLIDTDLLSKCGYEYIHVCLNKCQNLFWKDVFKAWVHFSETKEIKDVREDSILKLPLWYNKNIIIGKKTIFYRNWYDRGVHTINDLIKTPDNCTFYTFDEFIDIYNIRSNFLQFNGVIRAVKKYISTFNFDFKKVTNPFIPLNIEIFLKRTKGTKEFYNPLVKSITLPSGKKKWNELFEYDDITWKNIFKLPFQITKNTKLQWFQFRVVHHILTTNSLLFKTRSMQFRERNYYTYSMGMPGSSKIAVKF